MRDAEELKNVYAEIAEIHAKSFGDMRFGQFMLNFLGWVNSTKGRDPFFPESKEFVKYAKEYANNNSMWFQGWDLSVYGGDDGK